MFSCVASYDPLHGRTFSSAVSSSSLISASSCGVVSRPWLSCLDISPCGSYLYSGGGSHIGSILHLSSGKILATLPQQAEIQNCIYQGNKVETTHRNIYYS